MSREAVFSLKKLYFENKLDEKHKKIILEKRGKVISHHSDSRSTGGCGWDSRHDDFPEVRFDF